MRAPVTYIPDFLTRLASDNVFKLLWNDLAWVRHDKVPRREYYVANHGQDYTYGKVPRTYKSQPLHYAIEYVWQHAEDDTREHFNVCFLNGYEDGSDHLGWHSDDSPEMDDARPIAIVTLGAEREIWFREKNRSLAGFTMDPVDKLTLQHGSLCLMAPGMQDTHQHRIPKASFQPCGPRLSLTFRGFTA